MFHNGLELLGTISSMISTMSATWKLKVKFSCTVVSDSLSPMDCSLPGSSVHGILHARVMEWVSISFSGGFSWPRDQTLVSCTAGRFFTNWATRSAFSRLTYFTQYDNLYVHPCGIVRDFGKDTYTVLYFKGITNKELLYSTGNSSQCRVPAWMREALGGERIHVHVWLIPFDVHLKLPQHFKLAMSFPDSSVCKESTCNSGDPRSIPGLGRSTGEG